jgi:hypothetical protein
LPRAQFVEYDAASPAPRNACTKDTRKALLDKLQVWAYDEMTTGSTGWLERAKRQSLIHSGKSSTIRIPSVVLSFSTHLRVDTSDVRYIIPPFPSS